MPAYIFITRDKVRDQTEYELYTSQVSATFAGHAVTPMSLGSHFEVVEGSAAESVFLLQFPTYEEATAWYRSPAYQDLSKHRHLGSDHRYIIFDGLQPKA